MDIDFPISFTKMSGTGNDFILIDFRSPFLGDIDLQRFARLICHRNFSVGADGLILITEAEEADFGWHFFNADGSVAEMCGNGARCAARFAYENGIVSEKMCFLTLAGIIQAEVNGELIKIKMTPPNELQINRHIELLGQAKYIHSVNTGVPHAVLFVDNVKETPVFEWGRIIRNHEIFQPAGANANFVQLAGENHLWLRTYERGVEDETMACGTGAAAAAILGVNLGLVKPPVMVTTTGGEQLTIHLTWDKEAALPSEIFLEGPANIIYHGQLQKEALRTLGLPLLREI